MFLNCILNVLCSETAVLKYFDSQGIQVKKPELTRNFITVFNYGSTKLYLRSSDHPYFSNLRVFEDPCENRIEGIFNSATGYYNTCTKKLEFMFRDSYYNVNTEKDNNNLEILSINNSPQRFKEKANKEHSSESNPFADISNDKNEFNMPVLTPGKSPFVMKIFVFNNLKRVERFGKDIITNTKNLFEKVNLIFTESNVPIQIELSGILNFEDEKEIDASKSLLEYFKGLIEPTRFSRFNLKRPLAKCDLTILITETDSIKRSKISYGDDLIMHGMTYMGGSARLDASYSVVLTSEKDSDYFTAKKIAHEIGHSLNASHTNDESIMEKTTCKNCNESKRLFSEASKDQIVKFITLHYKIFNRKRQIKYKDDVILKTKNEAVAYAEERRKHKFIDIVKSRLRNMPPSLIGDGPNPYLVLFLYSLLLLLVFYYWK